MRRPRLRRLLIWLATSVAGACRAPAAPPPLEAFAAASLGPPFTAFDSARRSAGRQSPPTAFQFVPSVQAVRMMTDLGRVPDLLATADLTLFDSLVLPRHATWYAVFGSNALVLAYGPHVTPPADYRPSDWVRVHLAPGVRIGRSDPRVDPSGYRTLLAVELAARAAGRPALRDSLLAALPLRHVRRAEADLSALLTSGELDYAWTYRNLAVAHGHRWLELPDSIDQSNVALADWYGAVSTEIPGTPRSFTVRGTPILFGVTVPTEAPHRDAALGWVAELLCGRARAAIERTGFVLLDAARVVGEVPASLRDGCGSAN